MKKWKARDLFEFSLVGAMTLGALVAFFGFAWLPVYQAASVDAILTQAELRDPKLRDVVNRTHQFNAKNQAKLVWPYRVLGTMIFGLTAAGIIGLQWSKPSP